MKIIQIETITFSVPSIDDVGFTIVMKPNHRYIVNGDDLITLQLPDACPLGATVEIVGFSANGWTISQLAGQSIHIEDKSTTRGVMGRCYYKNRYDSCFLVCVVENTDFVIRAYTGGIRLE